MPPLIYNTDEEGYPSIFQYLHPGIKKTTFAVQTHQPHVFQQSVTLTASMWNENDSKFGKMNWSFENWRILGKYSPLYVGLACGFGIVLLIMSTVMLWRYCFVSASKKIFCKSTYGEITQHQKSLPLRKREDIDGLNGYEKRPSKLCSIGKQQKMLPRSATTGSMSLHLASKTLKAQNNPQVDSAHYIPPCLYAQSTASEPLMSPELYTSHLYLQKLESTFLGTPRNLSKSTPALEDLYAKVNFSKKKKNRMRKNEAAIIAMSKSHSGQNNNSLELFGSAVVVYNERTAL